MSLYNLINGVTPATFLILPMLGKHPDEYPRFRDCFCRNEKHPEYDDHIHIYTRTGGGNRETFFAENQIMRDMPEFVTDYDDDFDSTFAFWIFKVPERWKADYEKFKEGKGKEISIEYQKELRRVFPKLNGMWDKLFEIVS